ncbi:hypothetical protein SKTS_02510 [Sulfurimicrobium lacus]|uniref:Uncharacterized protein n=2 Tax=Sulfurimicrobium lacus TaxID=2715678 RepID=A0A6F8V9B7_9PROT|nr:hypothetical protein SKTS_02510 [Sulfurimicrobium lacus]
MLWCDGIFAEMEMAGFEFYNEETATLEKEIERLGMALDIDWSDDVQVRALAREALSHGASELRAAANRAGDYRLRAKAELFGLAAVMLRIMEKSAGEGVLTHGGPAWKSFGRALWEESSGA